MKSKSNSQLGRPRLKDVAALAGVSVSTVSDILNRSKNSWASQLTRDRVFAAAKTLGYRPNRTARSLRYGRSGIIGVISNSHFLNRRFSGIDKAAYEANYATVTSFNAGRTEIEDQLILNYLDLGVDGLIVYSSDHGPHTELKKLASSGFPLVTLDGAGRLDFPCDDVSPDFEEIGRLQARHLLELNRERICILTTSPVAKINHIREEGIAKELMDTTGKAPLVITIKVPLEQEQTSFDYLYSHVAEIMDIRRDEFDAVITLDSLGAILARAAFEIGVRMPEELAIVGTGNSGIGQINMLPLTSVDTTDEWIGIRAFQLLMDRIDKKSATAKFRQIKSKHKLIVRQSTLKTV